MILEAFDRRLRNGILQNCPVIPRPLDIAIIWSELA